MDNTGALRGTFSAAAKTVEIRNAYGQPSFLGPIDPAGSLSEDLLSIIIGNARIWNYNAATHELTAQSLGFTWDNIHNELKVVTNAAPDKLVKLYLVSN